MEVQDKWWGAQHKRRKTMVENKAVIVVSQPSREREKEFSSVFQTQIERERESECACMMRLSGTL